MNREPPYEAKEDMSEDELYAHVAERHAEEVIQEIIEFDYKLKKLFNCVLECSGFESLLFIDNDRKLKILTELNSCVWSSIFAVAGTHYDTDHDH